ncbi:putative kinase a-anchor protein neurobeachin [Operophtera brumata]|uniref:Putative kinase a-anchor protein neurobeachin n=1 Tax=Operophtera brumata TaxID=104452 RepID=A0A0L7L0I2_OPEBR|nr:putative kinase a-anchor protein neurobeachin [Operophtera brumata]
MHTAYSRRDNACPASVTALCAARAGRGLAVGDARGRVRFTALERRHHCRECGAVFCGRCTRYEAPVRRLRALRPVRVCQRCHDTIQAKKE